MKTYKRWIKFSFFVVWGLSVLVIFLMVALASIGMLSDKKMIQDTVTFNQVTLLMGFLSLPSALAGMLGIVNSEKKNYVATTHCPKCKHFVDIKLREEKSK